MKVETEQKAAVITSAKKKETVSEKDRVPEKECFSGGGGTDKKVLTALTRSPMTPDELSISLNMDISDIMISLTMLEIEGRITSLAGNRYIKK